MWRFTQHVRKRMAERGYTGDEVLAVLNGDVPALAYPSPVDENADMYFGRVGDKFLMIPVDRTSQAIITIRPMRKGETRVFLREVENG